MLFKVTLSLVDKRVQIRAMEWSPDSIIMLIVYYLCLLLNVKVFIENVASNCNCKYLANKRNIKHR